MCRKTAKLVNVFFLKFVDPKTAYFVNIIKRIVKIIT